MFLSDPKLRSFTSRGDYALAEEVELFSVLEPQVIGRAYADLLISLGQGHQMGVKLRAGTAELNPKNFCGHGLHTEMRHLAMARIPPIDVLRITTLVAATMVGADE